jgi:hypothetical protein
MEKLQREPAVIGGAITTVIETFVLMAIQMGWLNWDSEQIVSFNNFIVAFVPLVGLVAPMVLAYAVRARVTPVSDPRTADGQPANLVAK